MSAPDARLSAETAAPNRCRCGCHNGTVKHAAPCACRRVMQIKLDPNPCLAGWGPCNWGFAHACDRGGGHTGSHHCGQCDARTKDRPGLWETPEQFDGTFDA